MGKDASGEEWPKECRMLTGLWGWADAQQRERVLTPRESPRGAIASPSCAHEQTHTHTHSLGPPRAAGFTGSSGRSERSLFTLPSTPPPPVTAGAHGFLKIGTVAEVSLEGGQSRVLQASEDASPHPCPQHQTCPTDQTQGKVIQGRTRRWAGGPGRSACSTCAITPSTCSSILTHGWCSRYPLLLWESAASLQDQAPGVRAGLGRRRALPESGRG